MAYLAAWLTHRECLSSRCLSRLLRRPTTGVLVNKRPDYVFNIKAFLTYHFLNPVVTLQSSMTAERMMSAPLILPVLSPSADVRRRPETSVTGTSVSTQPGVGISTGIESSTAVNGNVSTQSSGDGTLTATTPWLPLFSAPFMGQIPRNPRFTGEGHAAGDSFRVPIAKFVGWNDHWKLVHLDIQPTGHCSCLLLVLQYVSSWTVFIIGGCSEGLFHACTADRSAGTAVSQLPAATPGIIRPRIAEVVQCRICWSCKQMTPS